MVEVRVPCSTANLGTGTDCLGLALSLYLTVTFEQANKTEFIFADGFSSPIPDNDNLILTAAKRLYDRAGVPFTGIRATVKTEIPQSRGLGSSASAIVAGLYGANALLGGPLSCQDIVNEGSLLEGHPDNIVPCAVGGLIAAMMQGEDTLYIKQDFPEALQTIACVPNYKLSTKKARSVLPESVPLKTALAQLQRACVLIAGLSHDRFDMLPTAADDLLFTPARRPLIPGYDEVCAAAREAGALTAMISGAGPTILAFCRPEDAEAVCRAMENGFAAVNISARSYALAADNNGTSVKTV